MGKFSRRTSTGPLILPPDLAKDNTVTQCLNILTNIDGHMEMAATRAEIVTPSLSDTRTRPQWRDIWTGVIMDVRNDGVGQYQR